MGRHSKNNTARANFTATEYQYVKDRWGSKESRLGGESMRNFDQCALCLATVVDPMACKEGHLFCKECIYTNLLEQKADIKAQQAALVRLAEEQEQQRMRAREQARAKVLEDFERNLGFGSASRDTLSRPLSIDDPASSASPVAGSKRKASAASIDDGNDGEGGRPGSLAALPDRAQRLAQRAEDEALASLEAEQRAARRRKLPAFWLPSLMPSEKEGEVDLRSLGKALEPRCRVSSEHGHPISIRSLTPVIFSHAPAAETTAEAPREGATSPIRICPSCKKALTNSHRLFTIRRCSHTFCNHCAERLIFSPAKESMRKGGEVLSEGSGDKAKRPAVACCPDCDAGLIKDLDKDVIKLHREGTGYASAGGAETKKKGIVFQG